MADTDSAPSTATPTRPRRAAAANGASRRSRATLVAEEATLEGQVAQLQAELKSITATLGQMGQTGVSELRSTAKAQAQSLAERGQSALDTAQDEFGAFEKQIKDTIREKPLTAIAGAVALGFLIAVITR